MIFVLLSLLATIFCIVQVCKDTWLADMCVSLSVVFGILTFLLIVLGCSINFGEKYYTGYIYEVTNSWGKTEGHIRFSREAGEDKQPSFCVNKEDAEELMQYVGKDVKVKVTEPAGFGWSYTKCSLPVRVEVIEEK